MKYFLLETLADHGRASYCFTNKLPEGIGASSYRLSAGESLREMFPEKTPDVQWYLGDDYPGLKLPSFIGNTCRLLAVRRNTAALIQAHKIGDAELIPFVLFDQRKQVHSEDYVFINPLGSVDCLNMDASSISRARSGKILSLPTIVLDSNKPWQSRDVFRIPEKPSLYVFSERLVDALAACDSTNFVFTELQQR